ncbi:MAG: polysaccharide deacetylase family protein [Treponema sp.]|nr:polysaccharide deacetylase family protein [Treponema sp.]
MFPNGKMKALTLSYDDGVEQDRRLIEILNRYHIKGAFNLNSGIQTGANGFVKLDIQIRRMNVRGLKELYAGHEIAVHGLTHPHLENLDEETVRNELEQDKINLERIFGSPVYGMAYPFGTYNDLVVKTVGAAGLRYARGVKSAYSFDIPRDLLTYQPTCKHTDPRLMELAEQFIKLKPAGPQVFYLWGHSYEFDTDRNWQVIEDFCRLMANREDIFYATNAQALLVI